MNSYDIGDTARLTFSFFDETGSPVDPDAFDVRLKPAGQTRTITTYPDESITRRAQGVYTYDWDLTIPGIGEYGTKATGNGKTAGDSRLFVRSSDVLD